MGTAINVILLVVVPLPSIAIAIASHTWCADHHVQTFGDHNPIVELWCSAYNQPFLALNVLFSVNVCVLFWIIELIQRSTWLIDPYWTLLPPLIHLFYSTHMHAPPHTSTRQLVVAGLLGVWCIRLTHSYFRREQWQVGAREDWRFTSMAVWLGRHWWWASFWLAYVSQQAMLVGLTLPLYIVAMHGGQHTWGMVDWVACILSLTGITLAAVADTQLHNYVQNNMAAQATGKPTTLVLSTGVWRYSRHPNYVGEQLWWWGLAVFAVACGGGGHGGGGGGWQHAWVFVGPLFNSVCMVPVTIMVEHRMVANKARADAYKAYQQNTGCWLPRVWVKIHNKRE